MFRFRFSAGFQGADRVGYSLDMLRRGAAAPSDDVDESRFGEPGDLGSHVSRRVVVLSEFVGQSGIGIDAYVALGDSRQRLDEGAHLLRTERAVEAYGDQVGHMRDGNPEGFGSLAGKSSSACVHDGSRNHYRHSSADGVEILLDSEKSRFAVQGVEDGLYQEQINSSFHEPFELYDVVVDNFAEGDGPVAGIVHVRREGEGLVCRADRTGDKARFVGSFRTVCIRGFFREPRSFEVQFPDKLDGVVVPLRNRVGVEGVGFDDVRTGFKKIAVDGINDVGLRKHEHIVVSDQRVVVRGEPFAPVIGFLQLVALYHGAHGTVKHQNALLEEL